MVTNRRPGASLHCERADRTQKGFSARRREGSANREGVIAGNAGVGRGEALIPARNSDYSVRRGAEAQSAQGHSCQAQAGDIEMTVRRERETASLRCALMRSGDMENIFREGRGGGGCFEPKSDRCLCSLKSSGEPELSGGRVQIEAKGKKRAARVRWNWGWGL